MEKMRKSGAFTYFVNEEDDTVTIKKIDTDHKDAQGDTLVIPSVINGFPVKEICDPPGGSSEYNYKKIVVSEGIEVLGRYAMRCAKMESIELPSTLKTIGEAAFENCENLAQVELPAGLFEIGRRAFRETAITRLNIPASVMRIENHAFSFCKKLRKIIFPPMLELITLGTCSYCNSLEKVILPANLRFIESDAFHSDAPRLDVEAPPFEQWAARPDSFPISSTYINGQVFDATWCCDSGVLNTDKYGLWLSGNNELRIHKKYSVIRRLSGRYVVGKLTLVFEGDCEFHKGCFDLSCYASNTAKDVLPEDETLDIVIKHCTNPHYQPPVIKRDDNLYIDVPEAAITLPSGIRLACWRRVAGIKNGEMVTNPSTHLWVGKKKDGTVVREYNYAVAAQAVTNG